MAKFKKKPVVIDAVRFNGVNQSEILDFYPAAFFSTEGSTRRSFSDEQPDQSLPIVEIRTLEGTMVANVGDWIIRGVKGEYYPCKPDIFKATYEPLPMPEGL
jgi:hypothetical protein